MNYIVSHSRNDCYIALYAPAFQYKCRGKRSGKLKDNLCIAAHFRKYIEACNSAIQKEADEFLSSYFLEVENIKPVLARFTSDKETHKQVLKTRSYKKSSVNYQSYNAGYLLAKTNQRLVNFISLVSTALSILKNRLSYSESYHRAKLESFIEGTRIYEPELACELESVLSTFFIKAQTLYGIVIDTINNNNTQLELLRQIDDYKHIGNFNDS